MTPNPLNITPDLSASVAAKTAQVAALLGEIAEDWSPAVFTNSLDTGRLPIETYDLMAKVQKHYRLKPRIYFPQANAVENYVRDHGINAFYGNLAVRETDESNGLEKFNPLADWREKEIWAYIQHNGVPYNTLHDKFHPSIGCAPCTRAITPGEDTRSDRWWWEAPESKECGLHVKG